MRTAELAAQRYHSLCEVYGMNKNKAAAAAPPGVEGGGGDPSHEPPPPPLNGSQSKEFRHYAKKAPHHRSSRIVLHYLKQLGVPDALLTGAKGDPAKYADPARIRQRANPRGGGRRRPKAAAEQESTAAAPAAGAGAAAGSTATGGGGGGGGGGVEVAEE
jgi:hypothetical protein